MRRLAVRLGDANPTVPLGEPVARGLEAGDIGIGAVMAGQEEDGRVQAPRRHRPQVGRRDPIADAEPAQRASRDDGGRVSHRAA